MRINPFTRPTIVAATAMFERLNQASFDQMVLRLCLENEVLSDSGISVAKKCAQVGRVVIQRGQQVIQTVDGDVTLCEAVVREAVRLIRPNHDPSNQTAFLRGLARDGYVVSSDDNGENLTLRMALPNEVDLPETDSEVNDLLKRGQFDVAHGHLNQAIEAHTRGDWAAANAQLRTFIESLFDEIARKKGFDETSQSSSENRRSYLGKIGYFALERHEWGNDGKNYINGLFKMLHTDGSHPGLSDEDHCTFRLHIALVTARTFLRRFHDVGEV